MNKRYLCPFCESNEIVVQGYVMAEWEVGQWGDWEEGGVAEDIKEGTESLGDSEFWNEENLRCKNCGATFDYAKIEEGQE